MPIDHSFFWFDLSRHRRKRSLVALRLVAGAGAGAFWLFASLLAGLLLHRLEGAPLRPVLFSFDGFVFLHAAACMAVGGYAGDLVFGRDVRNHTLTALQLLPLAPERFLARKLAFPIWTVAVTWAAGIPLAIVAALLNLTPVTVAQRGLLIAGLSGLAALVVTLLGTSGQLALPLDPLERRMRNKEGTCRGFLVIGAAGLALALAYFGWSAPERWPFFGLRIQSWIPGSFLTLALGVATVNHGRILLLGELASFRRPMILAVAGLMVVYLLVLGAFWPALPLWGRCLAVIGPLALALLDYWQIRKLLRPAPGAAPAVVMPARKEDPWTEPELNWLQARWNNPVLLRDLRALLHTQSLRRRLRSTLIAQLVLGVVFYFLVKRFGGAVFSGATSWLLTPLLSGGGAAATFWSKERKSGALPLLLLTPLTSRELLAGRLSASLLMMLPLLTLPFLLVIGAVVWLATTRIWMFGPLLLSVLPVLLSAWIGMGCAPSTEKETPGFQASTIFHLVRAGMLMLVPLGSAAVWLVARYGPVACCGLALLIGGLHVGFAVLAFREHVRKLEAYRQGDIDPGAI
jgi:hypothetical protein